MLNRAICLSLIAAASGFGESPETRTRRVLELFLAKNYDAVYEMFSPEMKNAITLENYKSQAAQIAMLGQPKSAEPKVETIGEYTAVTIPLHWGTTALDFRVTWNKAGQIAGTWFRLPAPPPWQPPAYSKPGSFTEHDVTIGGDEWKLPGTLALPACKGPFPGVVLVHGSGPNDRDETVGGARVFRDLAEGLASRGIAVLRYEKRTKVYPAKCAADPNFTMNQETVDDAVRAAALLRTQPAVGPGRVFVLGHSQGGYMAPRIARRDPRLAGIIVLAGNVRPLEDLILEQTEYLAALQGGSEKLPELKRQVEQIKRLEPGRDNPKAILGLPANYLLDLKGYNPAAEAAMLHVPMLILQGERDYQVTMKDFSLWKAALSRRKDVTLRSYPNLNHLFEPGEGKSTPAEYQRPEHVAGGVIEAIANWIRRS